MAFGAISAVTGVIGLGTSIAGGIKGGQANSAANAYQAQVAMNNARYKAEVEENNAVVANQTATRIMQGGEVSAEEESMKGANVQGAIKARQAANGIDVNTGSAVDVRAGAAEASKLNAETVLSNANLTAYGYRVKAFQSKEQAQLDLAGGQETAQLDYMGANQASTSATLGTLGTALDKASSLPWSWIGNQFSGSGGGGAAAP